MFVAAVASILVFGLNSLFQSSLTWAWTLAGQRMVRQLAVDMFNRLQRLSLQFHHHHPVGDLLSRLTTDSWCIYKLTDGAVISPIQKLVTLMTLGWVGWQLHPQLTGYAIATAPAMAIATVYFGKRIRNRARLGREAQSRLLTFVHQTLRTCPLFKHSPQNNKTIDNFKRSRLKPSPSPNNAF